MFSEDDFLLAKPARRERAAVVRIALMALIGCLALLAVLVIQARAQADALHPIGAAASSHQQQAPQRPPAGTPLAKAGSGA